MNHLHGDNLKSLFYKINYDEFVKRFSEHRSTKSWSLELNINNLQSKWKTIYGIKMCAQLYGKTGVGNSTNSKRTKVGIDKTKGIHTTKEVFKPTKRSIGL